MKPSICLVLAALTAGCASKSQPAFTDAGATPAADPYDHRQNPLYTTGAMAGFRSLYVDPKSYPASLNPIEPPPAPPIQIEGPDLPDDLFPAITVQVDMYSLDEGRTFTDLVEAVRESREGVVVQMPSEGLIFFPAPESENVQTRDVRRLGNLRIGNKTLSTMSEIMVSASLPETATNSMVQTDPNQADGFQITLVPRPPAPLAPTKGDLMLENTATAWAEVQINDAKVGVVGPLAHGTIAGVKAGTYKITFTLPNGYSWSVKKMTEVSIDESETSGEGGAQ